MSYLNGNMNDVPEIKGGIGEYDDDHDDHDDDDDSDDDDRYG